ncbi:MAG: hypothetical protein HOC70_09990 [Gammaproteobacteria bacterium]|jgi:hypothetical protein|nr:hypothetical protein [Gammaproteobacteria bacterium]MBT4493563.1 hypothetical protein [Gammaproteobacteria bacterium]MBT7371651.1 hypothetical protein [Gammaproteobacteria bacterium]
MAELLSRDEHDTLRQDVEAKLARIKIPRVLARQFYTRVGHRNVRDLTGQSQRLHKSTIFSLIGFSLVLILISLILLARHSGFAGVVAIPLTGIFWTILAGFTTEHGKLPRTIMLTVLALAAGQLLPQAYSWSVSLFVVSIFIYHTAHILAQNFLCRLLIESYDAFDMLADHIEIERDAD